jgi:hypothetical protein
MKLIRWTPEAKAKFLATLSRLGNVTLAAEACGLSRSRAYDLREEDADFAAVWDAAEAEAADRLEAEAWRRAVEGVDEPVFFKDEQIGVVKKYSDTLLVTLLTAHKPEKYAKRSKAEITGANGGPIEVVRADIDAIRRKYAGAPGA